MGNWPEGVRQQKGSSSPLVRHQPWRGSNVIMMGRSPGCTTWTRRWAVDTLLWSNWLDMFSLERRYACTRRFIAKMPVVEFLHFLNSFKMFSAPPQVTHTTDGWRSDYCCVFRWMNVGLFCQRVMLIVAFRNHVVAHHDLFAVSRCVPSLKRLNAKCL